MPFISDSQVNKIRSEFAKQKAKAANAVARVNKNKKAQEVRSSLETVGAAGAMGFLRGKFEDDAGVWNVPFIGFDYELVTSIAMIGSGMFELWGKNSQLNTSMINGGNGIGAHWFGQTMRKMSRAGKMEGRILGSFTQVAGNTATGANYRGLPQPRRQYASPYADRASQALASLGM